MRSLSLEQKLTLLITSTIVVVLAMSLALTYGTLARTSELEVSERLTRAAGELASRAAALRTRNEKSIDSLARKARVVAVFTADGEGLPRAAAAARPLLDAARRSAQDSTLPIELWTPTGRKLLHVGTDLSDEHAPTIALPSAASAAAAAAASASESASASAAASPSAPSESAGDATADTTQAIDATLIAVPRPGLRELPGRDSIIVGDLYSDGKSALYWVVAPITRDTTIVGYIAQQQKVVMASGENSYVELVATSDVTLLAHDVDGGAWIVEPGVPTAPRVPRSGIGPGSLYDSPAGRVIGAEAEVPGMPWVVFVETPLSAVHVGARKLVVTMAGLGVLLTIVGSIVSVVIGRRVARPLAALTNAAEAISQGDYARRVPFVGPDEIGRLGKSFNQMASEVDQARAQLQDRLQDARRSAIELERSNEQLQLAMTEAERLREDAQDANRAKSDFLAVMSHELRTPLNAIGGYAQLLDLGIHGPVTDAQHDALTRIARSQAHLLRLINDVLNFARVDAGQVRYAMHDIPVDETLAGIEPLVAPQMRDKGLCFTFRQSDPLMTVYADSDKLQQVVLNLLTNAIKFTPDGGHIGMDYDRDGETVHIRVRDDGPGIPEERLQAIFDPFVQLDRSVTQTRDGVGLGLAISRDLARGMGGDLTVESEIGVGSTFIVVLPVHARTGARTAVVA
ncbi:MAG: HAMP domain-containing sensor histidine kinase [Gemmatimonadota bacterium]